MSSHHDEWLEKLAERAIEYNLASDEFVEWLNTDGGKDAWHDYREKVIKPTGIDYPTPESLNPERFEAFFDWVCDESDHALKWGEYYVERNGDYEGQRGDYLMEQERDQ